MAANGPYIVPTYTDLGFSVYLDKPLMVSAGDQSGSVSSGGGSLNFDQMQTSGSLGSVIQVGGNNIVIDGVNRQIVINDGQNDRIIIGLV